MERPTSDVWKHYKKIRSEDGKKIQSVVCNYCSAIYKFPNATRLRNHLGLRCQKCPQDLRKDFQEENNEEDVDDVAVTSNVQSAVIASSSGGDKPTDVVQRSTKVRKMTSFLDLMSQEESEKIDFAVMRAICATGLPVSVLDNQYWHQVFNLLRPCYKIPSPFVLGGRLLNAEYLRVQDKVKNKINSAVSLGVMSDGWSNVRNEGIVNFIVTTPEPVFLKAVAPGAQRETEEYISDKLIKVIDTIGPEKTTAVITDNAKNMKKAWRLIKRKYDHIFTIGCIAHGLNLLMKDIMKLESLKELKENAKSIVKVFNHKHVVHNVFNSKQEHNAPSLKLPNNTRFSGDVLLFNSLQWLFILNDNFWMEIQYALNILKPIADVLTPLESDSATLSDVPYYFKKIEEQISQALDKSNLSETDNLKVLRAFKHRENFSCQPIHKVAYLLDPRYKDKNLSSSDMPSIYKVINKLCEHLKLDKGQVLANLANYRAGTGIWSPYTGVFGAVEHTTPVAWWQGLCAGEPIAVIAIRLLNIPPSSAACERVWSTFGGIHTKKRNRLRNEKTEKLVSVQWNLRLFDELPKKRKRYIMEDASGSMEENNDVSTDSQSESDAKSNNVESDTETDSSIHLDSDLPSTTDNDKAEVE
ncbi:PREDICTED: zinc finger BED domain-containing protein 1-like [Vollenhovia emeryi]|uniref:zinc finger BED domain-containing protein 1-like n=1 Tax=Vollenhovia emeryi TaxID=411798 RepID=UPI0005F4D1DF|nr:PREDICTED: zinc finger BED domain-containing protein 1-like [Vollenhovia emeryi]